MIINTGSTLNHNGTTRFGGGSYTGGGVFKKGNATINSATTWDVVTVDLDDGDTTVNADLTINADSINEGAGGFNGLVTIDSHKLLTVNMSSGEWTMGPSGKIIYNGIVSAGDFLDGSKLNMNGTMEIHGSGISKAELNIGSSAMVDIVDVFRSLQLFGDTTVAAGATFSGDGKLCNVVNRTLQLLDGADVDVIIENEGTLALGSSAGQTTGLDYIQTHQGTWDLEIGGMRLADFDQMTLAGTALLDGTLGLSLIMGYTPSLGDTFSILTAAGGVSGMFADILQPGTMPAGLMFNVNYTGTIVQLEIVSAPLQGDYNQDGFVNAADYTVWRDSLGQTGIGIAADGDGNNIVDQDDYLVWAANYGNSAPTASISVPEPTTLFLTSLIASLCWLLPRQKPEAVLLQKVCRVEICLITGELLPVG